MQQLFSKIPPLVERTKSIQNNRQAHYYLFSKEGFDEKLANANEENLTLMDLEELLR